MVGTCREMTIIHPNAVEVPRRERHLVTVEWARFNSGQPRNFLDMWGVCAHIARTATADIRNEYCRCRTKTWCVLQRSDETRT